MISNRSLPLTHIVLGVLFMVWKEVNTMKINKANALKLWEEFYGDSEYEEDFHGNIMYKYAYANENCHFI
jgi:hypothetical protein